MGGPSLRRKRKLQRKAQEVGPSLRRKKKLQRVLQVGPILVGDVRNRALRRGPARKLWLLGRKSEVTAAIRRRCLRRSGARGQVAAQAAAAVPVVGENGDGRRGGRVRRHPVRDGSG